MTSLGVWCTSLELIFNLTGVGQQTASALFGNVWQRLHMMAAKTVVQLYIWYFFWESSFYCGHPHHLICMYANQMCVCVCVCARVKGCRSCRAQHKSGYLLNWNLYDSLHTSRSGWYCNTGTVSGFFLNTRKIKITGDFLTPLTKWRRWWRS
mgnify:CR=1 FL=1